MATQVTYTHQDVERLLKAASKFERVTSEVLQRQTPTNKATLASAWADLKAAQAYFTSPADEIQGF